VWEKINRKELVLEACILQPREKKSTVKEDKSEIKNMGNFVMKVLAQFLLSPPGTVIKSKLLCASII
jgi:hypothetical protein